MTGEVPFAWGRLVVISVSGVTPRISVLTTAHNAGRYLLEAVESILGQTEREIELLLVDDGSTDGSFRLVESIDDQRLQIVRQPRRGLGTPVNEHLLTLRGEYIMRMDADDRCHPERAARQAAFLDTHPDVAMVGTQYQFFNDEGAGPKSRLPTEDAQIRQGLVAGWHTISHATTMFRRELLVQGLRYQWSGPGEDWAFIADCSLMGRLAVIDDVLYQYRLQASSSAWAGAYQSMLGMEYARHRLAAAEAGESPVSQEQFSDLWGSGWRHRLMSARAMSATMFRQSIVGSITGETVRPVALRAGAAILDPQRVVGRIRKRHGR